MSRVTQYACLVGLVLTAGACWPDCDDPTQPDCIYVLSRTNVTLPAGGGSDTISVTASRSSCAWSATSSAGWLTVTSGANNTGSGSVSFSAAANGPSARSGVLTVANQVVTLTQDGLPPPTFTLSGRVTDVFIGTGPRGDLGLSDVAVTATGPSQRSGSTDHRGPGLSEGNFTLSGLLAGTYTVSFAKTAYLLATTTVAISGDTTLPMTLALNLPSAVTTTNLTGYWSGTGEYSGAPFRIALRQNGNGLSGEYVDQRDDTPDVSGTYAPTGFTLRVYFGDTAFLLDCTIESAQQIRGVQRVQGRAYNFTMTR